MNSELSTPEAVRQQEWLVQLDTALRTRGLEAAGELAIKALDDGVNHPGVMNLAASGLFGAGRFGDALNLLERARAAAPDDPRLLNSIGLCQRSLGRLEEALQTFDRAIEFNPNMAAAHSNRGIVLQDLKYTNEARAAYERAAALDPSQLDAVASLAWLDAQAGDANSARTNADRVLMHAPSHAMARLASASAHLQMGDLDGADKRLSELNAEAGIEPEDRAVLLGLLGDLRDVQGRTAEAFAAYEQSNALQKSMYAGRFAGPGVTTALDHAESLVSWFEKTDREPWRMVPSVHPRNDDPKTHVFLVGFPRSGTTLLENVLAAHPDVVSLEERNCLDMASATYLASPAGLDQLARIDAAEADRQRASYWAKVRSFGVEPQGRVFIDKMPLASTALPLVAKLFPDARILFARRDPRDVVLSCFRRGFGMNVSMYQLLTLEGAAAYYHAVMRLSELYREILPVPQHLVRYESLVDDFEGTARSACDFLGLEWRAGMADFAANAQARGIATPSAAQVARGLNREGQGVWRRYREQMTSVLPLLDGWAARFGYEQ